MGDDEESWSKVSNLDAVVANLTRGIPSTIVKQKCPTTTSNNIKISVNGYLNGNSDIRMAQVLKITTDYTGTGRIFYGVSSGTVMETADTYLNVNNELDTLGSDMVWSNPYIACNKKISETTIYVYELKDGNLSRIGEKTIKLAQYNLEKDLEGLEAVMFEDENLSLAQLLGRSGIAHITKCVNINNANISQGADCAELQNNTVTIKSGVTDKTVEIKYDASTKSCDYYETSSATNRTLTIHVLPKPHIEATYDQIKVTNPQDGVNYYINDVKGEKDSTGNIVFDGLSSGTSYNMQVRKESDGKIKGQASYEVETLSEYLNGIAIAGFDSQFTYGTSETKSCDIITSDASGIKATDLTSGNIVWDSTSHTGMTATIENGKLKVASDGTTPVGNYSLHIAKSVSGETVTSNTVTITVGKGDVPTLEIEKSILKARKGSTLDVTLPKLPDGVSYGAVTNDNSSLFNVSAVTTDLEGKSQVTLTSVNIPKDTTDKSFTIKVSGGNNYNDTTLTVPVGFKFKTSLKITGLESADATYDGLAHKGYTGTPELTKENSDDEGDINDISADTLEYHYTGTTFARDNYDSAEAPTEAGTYKLTVRVLEDNETFDGSTTVIFTINKRKVSVTPKAGQSKAYKDNDPKFEYDITSGELVDSNDLNSGSLSRADGETVGTYEYKIGNLADCNPNYVVSLATGENVPEFEIKKKEVPVTEISDISKVYDGNPVSEPTFNTTENGDSITVEYKKQGADDSTYTTEPPKDYGKYVVRITVKFNDKNYETSVATKEFTIHKKEMKISADGYTGTYDGQAHEIKVNVTEPADTEDSDVKIMYGTKDADGNITYSENVITYKNAGKYEVYYKVTADGYEDATGSAVVNISPKPVSLEWSEREFIYDGNEHMPVAKVKESDIIGNDVVSVTVTGANKNVGNGYEATATALSNSNYTIAPLSPDVTVSYDIKPAKAVVKVDNAEKHIGQADPSFTYKATGLVSGESLTDITMTRTEGEAIGDYTITAKAADGSNSNYDLTFETGTLKIANHVKAETPVVENKTDATCTKAGSYDEVYYCASDSCKAELERTTKTIAALGHDWSEWAKDGVYEKSICSRCGQVKYRTVDASDTGSIEKDVEVAPGAPITAAALNNRKSELIEASGIFGQEEKSAIASGSDARVWLEISPATTISDTDKQKVEDKAKEIMGSDISKVVYFDVNLFKSVTKDGSTNKTQIAEPGIDIEVSVKLPENLIQSDSTISKAYQIIRLHNGEVDSFGADFDKETGTISFKTNKFSAYAIVFTDSHPTVEPTSEPTNEPTVEPTGEPTNEPTGEPTIKPTKQPVSVSVSKKTQEKNALALNSKLKVSQTGSRINISWGKVKGASGYDVYVQYCGKKFTSKSLNQVKSGSKTKIVVKKVNGKKLNLKKNYKIYVAAYKLVNGKKVILGKTIQAHIVGRKNYKQTNVKQIKAAKSSYSLKVGKKAKIKAKTILVDRKKKPLSNAHAKTFRYASTNKKVATVTKNGQIKAVAKGKCTVYVYARNGYAKKVTVTVK